MSSHYRHTQVGWVLVAVLGGLGAFLYVQLQRDGVPQVWFPLGILAAVKRNTWIDRSVLTFALAGFTVPPFWLGILLILVFPLGLGLFYTSGRGGLAHLVLPTIALSMTFIGRLTRVIRGLMVEILMADYVRTAHAKGVRPLLVIWRHAFRNVLLAVSTVLSMSTV